MAAAYSQPLSRAWQKTNDLLFHPFDLGRWFVLGWTAFLASLMEGGGLDNWSGRASEVFDRDVVSGGASQVSDAGLAWDWAEAKAVAWGVVMLVALGLALALLLAVVLGWIGSRGQFMLMDNIVHRRTEVAAPWREFKAEGDSLFVWSLMFRIAVAVTVGGIVLTGAVGLGLGSAGLPEGGFAPAALLALVAGGTLLFAVAVTAAYVEFFLVRIIVPVMHHRRCSCSQAWRVFGAAFRRQPWDFVLYGLFHLGLAVVIGALLIGAGLLTFCIGFLLMMIPYIGTVLTLPVPVLQRSLDLEWLSQFGPELYAFPIAAAPEPSAQFEGDGTVVRPEDAGQDTGGNQPGPEDA